MKQAQGDLWDFHDSGAYICITTNGDTRRDGQAVMGRGIASQAKKRYPELPVLLGDQLQRGGGNRVHAFEPLRLFTFPVKYHWKEQANLALIVQSAHQLVSLVDCSPLTVGTKLEHVYLPRPGCGNGGLMWSVVIHFIQPILDDRFTVVEINGA